MVVNTSINTRRNIINIIKIEIVLLMSNFHLILRKNSQNTWKVSTIRKTRSQVAS